MTTLRYSLKQVSLLVLTLVQLSCGGGSSGEDESLSPGLKSLDLTIIDNGSHAPPSLLGSQCLVFVQKPSLLDLLSFLDPDSSTLFVHIGESIDACLNGSASSYVQDYRSGDVLLDQSLGIDYQGEIKDCGQGEVMGCYQSWLSRVVVIPEVVQQHVSQRFSFQDWEYEVVGHEVWHAVVGNWHD